MAGGTRETYEPTIKTWTERAPLPVPRFDAAAVTGRDGKIYVMGGWKPNPADATVTLYARGLEIYDPKTNTWRVKAPVPTARNGGLPSPGPHFRGNGQGR